MVSRNVRKLSPKQLAIRARRIRLILTDNDGVLTDTGVYYDENGEAFKRFSIRDGMGVELLRQQGIETAIITSEQSPSVRRRAEKLRMSYLFLGVKDKAGFLDSILRETSTGLRDLGYIGDDVNDLEIIRKIRSEGLTAAPSDAMPSIRKEVQFVCSARGGNGAFRDFAEWILRMKGASPGNG